MEKGKKKRERIGKIDIIFKQNPKYTTTKVNKKKKEKFSTEDFSSNSEEKNMIFVRNFLQNINLNNTSTSLNYSVEYRSRFVYFRFYL